MMAKDKKNKNKNKLTRRRLTENADTTDKRQEDKQQSTGKAGHRELLLSCSNTLTSADSQRSVVKGAATRGKTRQSQRQRRKLPRGQSIPEPLSERNDVRGGGEKNQLRSTRFFFSSSVLLTAAATTENTLLSACLIVSTLRAMTR